MTDSITIWGDRLVAGDSLDQDQRDYLTKIVQNANSEFARQTALNILENDGSSPSYRQLLHLEHDSDNLSIVPADEITVRAREAFIAMGGVGADLAYAIRRGEADHLSAIQGAIRALRASHLPVGAIHQMGPAPVMPPVPVKPQRGFVVVVIDTLDRVCHRIVRFATRYDSARQRNLKLAARLVLAKRDHETALRQIEQAKQEKTALSNQLLSEEARRRMAESYLRQLQSQSSRYARTPLVGYDKKHKYWAGGEF